MKLFLLFMFLFIFSPIESAPTGLDNHDESTFSDYTGLLPNFSNQDVLKQIDGRYLNSLCSTHSVNIF